MVTMETETELYKAQLLPLQEVVHRHRQSLPLHSQVYRPTPFSTVARRKSEIPKP